MLSGLPWCQIANYSGLIGNGHFQRWQVLRLGNHVPVLLVAWPLRKSERIDVKACIIYDTRYGNTEKIAKSLEMGLKESGIETYCSSTKDVSIDTLNQYDLLCVGAPTEWHSASKPAKDFLESLKKINLAGKFGFAFDTALTRPLSGSGAKHIENELKKLGLQMIEQRQSAVVFLKNGSTSGAWLKDGEIQRFKQMGNHVGTTLTSRGASIPV